MSNEECLRVLGVGPDASAASIRKAYLDLVRVWHPDRFQSDVRLRQIAEEKLRKINDAYTVLKNYRPPVSDQGPSQSRSAERQAPSNSAERGTAGTATEHAPSRAQPTHTTWSYRPRYPMAGWNMTLLSRLSGLSRARTGYALLVAVLCAAPVLAVVQLVPLLRVPLLDTDVAAVRALRPEILTPMRIINPLSTVRVASDTLTEWARGDAIDLWKPALSNFERTGTARPLRAEPQNPDAEGLRKYRVRHPSAPAPAKTMRPANGTELIRTGPLGGAGDLRVVNRTNLEAVVKLVGGNRTLRALYIAPKGSVIMRSIRIGVYELHTELGNDLDAKSMRFQSQQFAPEPLGPFQFLEFTTDSGTSGKHYEVALSPQQ